MAGGVTESAAGERGAPQKTPWGAVLLFCLLFFIFGFVTWLNGPLITFSRLAFNVSESVALLVPSVFYLSYFFLSIPAALLLRKTGMKRGMSVGLMVMALGAICFAQFASGREFAGTLTSLFIIGGGLAILQTASNPYISVLGPIDSAAQRIAVMGMFNKGAGFLAPIIVGTFILHGIGDLESQISGAADPAAREAVLSAFAARIHMPYLGMGAFLALLAVFVWFSPLPSVGSDANPDSGRGSKAAVLQMIMGFFAIFFYVGVEVMAGDAIITYADSFGIPADQTKFLTSATLIAMIVGYIVGLITIPRYISQQAYLKWSAVLGVILTISAFMTKGYISVACVAALGFANAMMWPAIFPLGIKGLGKLTELGSAFLVMGIAGGGVVMSLYGFLKATFDFQLVFLCLMVPCYLYILFFAILAGRKDEETAKVQAN